MEDLFRSYVEDGTIEIGTKSAVEILTEYRAVIQDFIDTHTELRHIPDHRAGLFQRAQNEAIHGDLNIAVTLCALWIEHTVNGSLVAALERSGYDSETVISLIRDMNLRNKITVLWKIVGLAPLQEEHIRLVDQITQARNAFVHYKWRPRDDAEYEGERSRLREAVVRSYDLKEAFAQADSVLHWNGREEEIMAVYHADMTLYLAEVGRFTRPESPQEESASNRAPSS
jgi:hypothetical protein